MQRDVPSRALVGQPRGVEVWGIAMRTYHGPTFWNIGMAFRTWEGPSVTHTVTMCAGGSDPMEFALSGGEEGVFMPRLSALRGRGGRLLRRTQRSLRCCSDAARVRSPTPC